MGGSSKGKRKGGSKKTTRKVAAPTIEEGSSIDTENTNSIYPPPKARHDEIMDFDTLYKVKENGKYNLEPKTDLKLHSMEYRMFEVKVSKALLQDHIKQEEARVEKAVAKEKVKYAERMELVKMATSEKEEEADCCPICLEELHPQNCWRDENYEFLCCGKKLCDGCAADRVQ